MYTSYSWQVSTDVFKGGHSLGEKNENMRVGTTH